MAEQLVKIVQTWVDDETGQTTEKTFTYKDGGLVGQESKVTGEAEEADSGTKTPKGKLPADFPGYDALDKAGVHTYKQLSKYADDYTAIAGVDGRTAKKITKAVAAESGE